MFELAGSHPRYQHEKRCSEFRCNCPGQFPPHTPLYTGRWRCLGGSGACQRAGPDEGPARGRAIPSARRRGPPRTATRPFRSFPPRVRARRAEGGASGPPPPHPRRTARPDNKGAWPSAPRGVSVGTRPPGAGGHVPRPPSACYGTARRGNAGGVGAGQRPQPHDHIALPGRQADAASRNGSEVDRGAGAGVQAEGVPPRHDLLRRQPNAMTGRAAAMPTPGPLPHRLSYGRAGGSPVAEQFRVQVRARTGRTRPRQSSLGSRIGLWRCQLTHSVVRPRQAWKKRVMTHGDRAHPA